MKHIKTILLPLISLVGIYFGFFHFQNCAKVSYKTQNGVTVTETGTGGGGTAGDKVAEINPEFFSDPADLKILLVVDDSFTMSQSQQALSQAMDSLLDPTKGRNSEIRIVSTTGVLDNNVDYAYDEAVGTSGSTTVRNYAPKSGGRHAPYKILKTYSDSQFNEMKQMIKAEVLRVGVAGSDTEESLCAVLRQIYEEGSTKFFNPGDKTAIVILSDENDASTFETCSKTMEFRNQAQIGVMYGYDQERALVTVRYEVNNDNVPTQVTSQIGIPLAHGFTQESNTVCSSADGEKSRQALTIQGYNVIEITDCRYTLQKTYFYGSDFGDDGTVATRDFCSQSFTYNNRTYTNLYQYWQMAGFPVRAGSCHKQPLDSGSLALTGVRTPVIPESTTAGQNKDLIGGIKSKSESLFGSGYIVASLVRRQNDGCPLQSGQSVGTLFETMTQTLGSNATIESLCASSFSSTLSRVSNFVVNEAKKSYQLRVLETGEYIKGINVKRGSNTFTLSSHQYEVVGSTFTFLTFEPQTGDLFQVIIGKK